MGFWSQIGDSIHFASAIGVDVAGTPQGLFASCRTQLLAAQDDSKLVMKWSFEKCLEI